MPLTPREVRAALGEVDEIVVAEIIGLGATAEELVEAQAWVTNDEPLFNRGKRLPEGRIGRLVDILATIDEEAEAEPGSSRV